MGVRDTFTGDAPFEQASRAIKDQARSRAEKTRNPVLPGVRVVSNAYREGWDRVFRKRR